MAVLQKIRNKSVLLVTVIAIALVLFIVQMYFESGSALINQSKQNVGEVSGKSITVQEYQEMVDQFQTVYEIQRGSSSVNEDELNQIKDQAWNNYIQSTLIKEECEKLGILEPVASQPVGTGEASGSTEDKNPVPEQPVKVEESTGENS